MLEAQPKKTKENKGRLKTVGFQISEPTHKKLKLHALKNGVTLRALLTEVVENLVK